MKNQKIKANQGTRIIITESFYNTMKEVLDNYAKIESKVDDFFNEIYPIPTPHKTFGWGDIMEAANNVLDYNIESLTDLYSTLTHNLNLNVINWEEYDYEYCLTIESLNLQPDEDKLIYELLDHELEDIRYYDDSLEKVESLTELFFDMVRDNTDDEDEKFDVFINSKKRLIMDRRLIECLLTYETFKMISINNAPEVYNILSNSKYNSYLSLSVGIKDILVNIVDTPVDDRVVTIECNNYKLPITVINFLRKLGDLLLCHNDRGLEFQEIFDRDKEIVKRYKELTNFLLNDTESFFMPTNVEKIYSTLLRLSNIFYYIHILNEEKAKGVTEKEEN